MNANNNKSGRSRKPTTKAGKAMAQKKSQQKRQTQSQTRDSRVINAPVAQTKVKRTSAAVIKRASNGDIVVSHREFIRDIFGSNGFQVLPIPINPGLSGGFPWLSAIASNYESYCFEKLRFEFQTTSVTTSTGTVMAAIDYDASDPSPVTKQQLATYRGFVRSSPWENFEQRSISEDLKKRKSYYVRTAALSANQDIKLFDTGNLFMATTGQAIADPQPEVGELYVDYTVRLMTPQLSNPAVGLSKSSKFSSTNTVNTTVTGSSAPIVMTGNLSDGAVTFTATDAYNCLVTFIGTISTGTPGLTLSGTATLQTVQSFVNAQAYSTKAEAIMLPGQTIIVTLSSGSAADWNSLVSSFGQFNAAVI